MLFAKVSNGRETAIRFVCIEKPRSLYTDIKNSKEDLISPLNFNIFSSVFLFMAGEFMNRFGRIFYLHR